MTDDVPIPGLVKIPVRLVGEWLSQPKRDWHGSATANEPIVAVSFLRWNCHSEWCLSDGPDGNTIEVRLTLFPYDKSGLDVQVNASIGGGGCRYRSLVSSPAYLPEMPIMCEVETGRIVCIATIKGEPSIGFLGLFLARRDVKRGRNGIWHIRRDLRERLPGQLLTVLTYGRTGQLEDEMRTSSCT